MGGVVNIYIVNGAEQALIIDKMKNCGCEVIQVSNGLLVKTSKSLMDLQGILDGAIVKHFDSSDPNLSKDAKVFAGVK